MDSWTALPPLPRSPSAMKQPHLPTRSPPSPHGPPGPQALHEHPRPPASLPVLEGPTNSPTQRLPPLRTPSLTWLWPAPSILVSLMPPHQEVTSHPVPLPRSPQHVIAVCPCLSSACSLLHPQCPESYPTHNKRARQTSVEQRIRCKWANTVLTVTAVRWC